MSVPSFQQDGSSQRLWWEVWKRDCPYDVQIVAAEDEPDALLRGAHLFCVRESDIVCRFIRQQTFGG